MGANEKHAATYHGGKYTPDTEKVEDSYTMDQVQISLRKSKVVAREEFRRWLEAVRAEAKAEALNEAADKIDQIHSFGELPNGAIREEFRKEYWAFTEASKADWLRIRANQYKENQS